MKSASSSQKRLVETPGYHIKPKYDLKGLRKKISEKQDRDYDVVLPLTPMIDMFSMLVIFLLLNFSATGEAFFVNKSIKLPEAKNAQPLQSRPLISIHGNNVSLDTELPEIGSRSFVITEAGEIPGLVQALAKLKELQQNLQDAGIEPKTEINLQADKKTSVLKVKHVMNTLMQEGFTGVNFAVREIP